jgi:4-methylaminobutanoate oxidase (formaldehyde-forming)
VTVTRLAPDRFRVVTGAGYLASDLAWLRDGLERSWPDGEADAAGGAGADGEAGAVEIRDVSGDLATIGLWGPRARHILAAAADDDVGDAALPIRTAREIRVASAPVLASRISYAGELGWELTTPAPWAVVVWDALRAAGVDQGLEPFGYRALDMLRMEKGYRYYGADLTMLDTPFEAGLGSFVRLDRGPFTGRDALLARREAEPGGPARRLRTVRIGDDEWQPIYGGEAVRHGGVVIGRLRSAAYAPTVSATIGYVYCSAVLGEGTEVTVDVFDTRLPAILVPDALWDPMGERMRARG